MQADLAAVAVGAVAIAISGVAVFIIVAFSVGHGASGGVVVAAAGIGILAWIVDVLPWLVVHPVIVRVASYDRSWLIEAVGFQIGSAPLIKVVAGGFDRSAEVDLGQQRIGTVAVAYYPFGGVGDTAGADI